MALLSVVALGCAAPSEQAAEPTATVEQPSSPAAATPVGTRAADFDAAPDFTIATLDGGTFTLSDFRGTPVVLNFWAPW